MSLALANAVSVLAPDGTEIARVVDDALFDNPPVSPSMTAASRCWS